MNLCYKKRGLNRRCVNTFDTYCRMVGRAKLLKETRGERWFDGDWTTKTIHVETGQFMSEIISLAILWVDSKTYQGNLVEKNATSVIFCQ